MRLFAARRRKAWPALGITVAVGVGAHFWRVTPASGINRSSAVAPVAATPAQPKPSILRLTGAVSALRSATLFAPPIQGSRAGVNRGGAVATMNAAGVSSAGSDFNLVLTSLAKAGARVKAGEVVARFDTVNQQQRLDDYKDAVVQMDANIKHLMSNLEAAKQAHRQTVIAAKAAWDQSILDSETDPVVSVIQAETYKLDQAEAEATYKQLAYEDSLVDEQQQAEVRAAELNRDQAKLELERAESNIAKMTIRAPIDGIIVMAPIVRNGEFGQVREGDQIYAGQPFMYVVDTSALVLQTSLNQVDGERIRPGMKAVIRIDAYPGCELPGTVVGVGAMAQTSTFRASYIAEIPVRVRIEGSDPRLIPDLTGSADIKIAEPALAGQAETGL